MIDVIIPARGGSKGIPRKNIINICGFPLISYTIQFCKMIKNIRNIYVSTDDEEIANISLQYGATIIKRPLEYSLDTSLDIEFLNHFFSIIKCDEIVFFRPTVPIRNRPIIEKAIRLYFENKQNISSLRSVHKILDNPYKTVKIINGFCESIVETGNKISDIPRQAIPDAYKPNGQIDIVKRDVVLSGSVYGDKIFPIVCKKNIDIDSHNDILKTQRVLKNRPAVIKKLFYNDGGEINEQI